MRRLSEDSAQSRPWFVVKRWAMVGLGASVMGCALTLGGLWNVPGSGFDAVAAETKTPKTSQNAVDKPASKPRLLFMRKVTESAIVYLIKVPAGAPFQVVPQGAPSVSTLAQWPFQKTTQGAINAGYFDPINGLTTSHVTLVDGASLDPGDNPRLMKNPDLAPYLPAILNRTEWRTLHCSPEKGAPVQYQIAAHGAPLPAHCQLKGALGGGPRLLPYFTPEEEAFYKTNGQGRVVRDPLGVYKPNSRSAVGLTAAGDVVLLMVGQSNTQPGARGLSLPQTAEVLKSYGVVEAMALDGGSSSSLWFQGNVFWGKVTPKGDWVKRPVKTILAIEPYPSD